MAREGNGAASELMGAGDAGRILGLSADMVRLLARDGRLPTAVKSVRGVRLFRRADVEALAAERAGVGGHGARKRLSAHVKKNAGGDEMFRRLIDSVRDYAIFLLDPEGHIASWNVGAQRIKGYTADEIIGQHFSVFYPDDDVRAGKCEYELEEAGREGRFEDEGWRVRKDGSRFWASVVISAVRDDEGGLLGFSKVTRDLTERKRMHEEQSARIAAEHANRAKDEFIAMLGHELRNPLTAIVTAVQLMKRHGDERGAKHREIIDRQVRHMMRLIDDLLDISRIATGKIKLEKKQVVLREILGKAVEVATPIVEQRSHELTVDIPEREIALEADDVRLTQVFANLVVNAAKYTPPSGRITVYVRPGHGQVAVEVRDNGMGIAPQLLPKVFDLFVQAHDDDKRSAGGLGVGLTLVRTLVQMHGGSVEAESPGVGKGSTFTVRLPLAGAHSQPLS
jgi:PAS domain S-box-containing protein